MPLMPQVKGDYFKQPFGKAQDEPGSALTIDYAYDPLYRLTAAEYSTGDSYHYTYDAVGNRLTQDNMVNGQSSMVNYAYDSANRLTTVGAQAYTFDANGNLLSDAVNTYVYDSANRLTSVLGPSSSSQYAYSGLGDRISQTVGGVSTNYTLDLNAGLTQVLDDGTNTYAYGLGRISQHLTLDTGTPDIIQYFLGDALGSVRQLTNSAGEVTFAKAYDPYGNVTQTSGESYSDFAYTGEQQDASGLTYLRARYYNPADGRFLNRDTFAGYSSSSQSQNRFAYTQNNPIRYTDSSGHSIGTLQAELMDFIADPLHHTINQTQKNHGVPIECRDWSDYYIAGGVVLVGALILVAALPVILAAPDSAIDVASIAFDVYTGDAASLALDTAALLIPGVTGLGALSRVDDAYDAVRLVNNADNSSRILLPELIPPRGFDSAQQYRQAMVELDEILGRHGIDDAAFRFRGTSTTGLSMNPKKPGKWFKVSPSQDIDLGIESSQLSDILYNAGQRPSANVPGLFLPNKMEKALPQQILDDIAGWNERWTSQLGIKNIQPGVNDPMLVIHSITDIIFKRSY